jgi:hypothetical protein
MAASRAGAGRRPGLSPASDPTGPARATMSQDLQAEQTVHPRSAPPARWLGRCQILSRGLARFAVCDRLELDLLAFSERAHIRAFDRTYMDENVLASVFRLNEAESFLSVEELDCSNLHDKPFNKLAPRERIMRPLKRSMFRRELSVGARHCPVRVTDNQYGRNSKRRIWAHFPAYASAKATMRKMAGFQTIRMSTA